MVRVAAIQGHAAVGQLLLATEGIDVNATNEDGWTAIMWAAKHSHLGMMALLLSTKGIDVNGAAHAAAENGMTAQLMGDHESRAKEVRRRATDSLQCSLPCVLLSLPSSPFAPYVGLTPFSLLSLSPSQVAAMLAMHELGEAPPKGHKTGKSKGKGKAVKAKAKAAASQRGKAKGKAKSSRGRTSARTNRTAATSAAAESAMMGAPLAAES